MLQLCLTFCDPMDCSPPGSSVHEILQARICRQEYWSGFLCPPPGDLPDPGIEPALLLLHWQVSSLSLVPILWVLEAQIQIAAYVS